MLKIHARGGHDLIAMVSRLGRPQKVVPTGLLLVLVGLALHAWALYPSWFFLDDYVLLDEAQGQGLDLGYLTTPVNDRPAPGLLSLIHI